MKCIQIFFVLPSKTDVYYFKKNNKHHICFNNSLKKLYVLIEFIYCNFVFFKIAVREVLFYVNKIIFTS